MSLDSRAGAQRRTATTEVGRNGPQLGVPAVHQDPLFDDGMPDLDEEMGYRGPIACSAAGITYRQLDYWARTKLVQPSLRNASGSGSARLYSFRDILVLKVVKRLLDTGVSLQQIRSAIDHLRERGVEDLAQITLMSDGASVYECTSPDEVIDLVQGGQGVFGIAVGRVWREVEGSLAEFPRERSEEELPLEEGALSATGTAGASAETPEPAAFAQQDELAKLRERRRSQAS